MEGFALYGSSLHANGFTAELPRMDDNIRQAADEMSPPRGPRAVVPYSAGPGEVVAVGLEKTSADAAGAFADAGLIEFGDATSVSVVRSSARRLWNLTAGIWANWRREREIAKAVRALAEFDDRTLRDMGIGDRAQIDRTVRYGRDF
jgi:uncharacterized protein YjiS (DUF1127 family)